MLDICRCMLAGFILWWFYLVKVVHCPIHIQYSQNSATDNHLHPYSQNQPQTTISIPPSYHHHSKMLGWGMRNFLWICSFLFVFSQCFIGGSNAQFPYECAHNATKENATCCPIPPGTFYTFTGQDLCPIILTLKNQPFLY